MELDREDKELIAEVVGALLGEPYGEQHPPELKSNAFAMRPFMWQSEYEHIKSTLGACEESVRPLPLIFQLLNQLQDQPRYGLFRGMVPRVFKYAMKALGPDGEALAHDPTARLNGGLGHSVQAVCYLLSLAFLTNFVLIGRVWSESLED